MSIIDCPFSEPVRNPKENSLTTNQLTKSISPLPPAANIEQEEAKPKNVTVGRPASVPVATRWPGVRKEYLTKEEEEKFNSNPNNCNPS